MACSAPDMAYPLEIPRYENPWGRTFTHIFMGALFLAWGFDQVPVLAAAILPLGVLFLVYMLGDNHARFLVHSERRRLVEAWWRLPGLRGCEVSYPFTDDMRVRIVEREEQNGDETVTVHDVVLDLGRWERELVLHTCRDRPKADLTADLVRRAVGAPLPARPLPSRPAPAPQPATARPHGRVERLTRPEPRCRVVAAPQHAVLTPLTRTLASAHCRVCGGGFHAAAVTCPTCETPHHDDCWEYNRGCAVYGCGTVARSPHPADRPTSPIQFLA